MPDFSIERQYWDLKTAVAGIDEAGRGALAGPVVAAAVIFPNNTPDIEEIDDSKKLSPKKREELCKAIKESAMAWAVGYADCIEIDKINIFQATQSAMHKAIRSLSIIPGHLLIDGNLFNDYGIPYSTVVKGDTKSISIAAASIIAKVTRDRLMVEQFHNKYPNYNFSRHKGYATALHREAIKKYGICDIHRKSFLKKILNQEELSLF